MLRQGRRRDRRLVVGELVHAHVADVVRRVQPGYRIIAARANSGPARHRGAVHVEYGIGCEGRLEEGCVGGVDADDAAVDGIGDGVVGG